MLDALKPSSMEIMLTLSKINPDGEIHNIYIERERYLCVYPLRSRLTW